MIKKILLSQTAPVMGKSPYMNIEKKYGVEIVYRPFISTEILEESVLRKQIISLKDYSALMFVSKVAVDAFFSYISHTHYGDAAEKLYYFCPSDSVEKYLSKYVNYRKRKVFTAKFKLNELEANVSECKQLKYLLMTSEAQQKELCSMMDRCGVYYRSCVCYKTVDNPLQQGESLDYDALFFFNSASIKSFLKIVPDFQQGEKVIGGFGEKTIQTLKELGLRVDIDVPKNGVTSVPEALDIYLKEHK
ncbi:MAG TPA: uroporphyrinogen-III synthase [Porphyromonadaceae bacterium]|nr:uroporphyrinogen-III synthase [Porphyromonadaceae bacterium]